MIPNQAVVKMAVTFQPELYRYVTGNVLDFSSIRTERKRRLAILADAVRTQLEEHRSSSLIFICTHNSRRSHLAQIWTYTAAQYYGITGISTYSGGTETTAFHPNAIAALERAGFRIESGSDEANPVYRVFFSDVNPPLECFSKKWDHPTNPHEDFIAVMTCSDADENCPYIPGAASRIPVTYEDPKKSDHSDREETVYDERTLQIATELFYMVSLIRNPQ